MFKEVQYWYEHLLKYIDKKSDSKKKK
jgi:hypothetical protein